MSAIYTPVPTWGHHHRITAPALAPPRSSHSCRLPQVAPPAVEEDTCSFGGGGEFFVPLDIVSSLIVANIARIPCAGTKKGCSVEMLGVGAVSYTHLTLPTILRV